jgi:hypothetical protein
LLVTTPFFADDFLRREREQAEQLRTLMEPTASLLRAQTDLLEMAVPASVRSMLEMHEQAMERYRAFLPDVEQITRSIRDIGMMARQPYLDAMASIVAQVDRHAQLMEQVGASAVKLRALAFPELQQRFAMLDIDRADYLVRDAQVFQRQVGDATARLLEQLDRLAPCRKP